MYGGGIIPPGAMWNNQTHNGLVHTAQYFVPGFSETVNSSSHFQYVQPSSFTNQHHEGYITTTTSTNIPGLSESVSIFTFGDNNLPITVNPTSVISSVPTLCPDLRSQCTSVYSSTGRPITTSVSQPAAPLNENIVIENSCLSFIRSQMFRVSKDDVITSTSVNFGLQEIKDAREALYRKTGTKVYKYVGPKDPSTQDQRSKFCVSSIIQKIEDLNKNKVVVRFLSTSEDLYRLSKMIAVQSGGSTPDCFSKENLEDISRKITLLRNDVNYLKNLPHNKSSAEIPAPRFIPPSNRQNLLKEFPSLQSPARSKVQGINSVDSPNKRQKSSLSVNPVKSTGQSRTPGSPAWNTVQKKRNRPDLDHVPKGKPPRPRDSTAYELFLFRYDIEESPRSILKYYKDVGASSAFHVRNCGGQPNQTKSFVIKFKDLKDFKTIVRNLPEYTGARPYTPEPPSEMEDRPQAYFNSGGIIRGPNIEAIFSDDDEDGPSMMDATDIPSPSNASTESSNTVSVTSSSLVMSAASTDFSRIVSSAMVSSITSAPNSGAISDTQSSTSIATSVSRQSSIPSTSVNISGSKASVSIQSGSSMPTSSLNQDSAPTTSVTTTSSAPSPVRTVLDSIKALDSPHLRTSSIGYESVVHEQ